MWFKNKFNGISTTQSCGPDFEITPWLDYKNQPNQIQNNVPGLIMTVYTTDNVIYVVILYNL